MDARTMTYEELLSYARRWRHGTLTEQDKTLLEAGISDVAYKQVVDGKEYIIPLPRNIRLLSVSDQLAARLTHID